VAIHPDDDVAVALRPLAAGEIGLRREDSVTRLVLREAVGTGHKLALRDIAAGEIVRKYGEAIGEATAAIPRGAHVHVHNLRSRRARAVAPGERADTAPVGRSGSD